MKVSDKLVAAINDQINFEMHSGYVYLAMAAWCESQSLPGAAHYLRVQAAEENEHAMKFFRYLAEVGAGIALTDIKAGPAQYTSLLDVFEKSLAHEQVVTARINKLMDQALAEKDHATAGLLQWFVKEQVEEEANAQAVIDQLKIGGHTGAALLFIDARLGERKAG